MSDVPALIVRLQQLLEQVKGQEGAWPDEERQGIETALEMIVFELAERGQADQSQASELANAFGIVHRIRETIGPDPFEETLAAMEKRLTSAGLSPRG